MTQIKPLIFRGKQMEGYYINDDGQVFTDYKVSTCSITKKFKKIKTEKLFPIKAYDKKTNLNITLTFSKDLFEYNFRSRDQNDRVCVGVSVHSLVMETFRPINEYPPDRLKGVWNQIPEEAKEWIRETVVINHIDHDYTNNKLSNLEYVTPRENSRKAKEFYGGNMANKKKFKSNKNKEEKEEKTTLEVFMN
jgi:hypothetical protein